MAFNYKQPELSLMLDLLRQSNDNFPLTLSELSWGLPTHVDQLAHGGRDTKIKASITQSTKYRGSGEFFYNRLPLHRTKPPCGPHPKILIGMKAGLVENLSYINEALGIQLEAVSVVDQNLNLALVNYTDWTLIEVVAHANSRVYSGSVRLNLKRSSNLA